MIKNIVGVVIFVTMVLWGCTADQTQDIEIEVQTDPKANFSGYNTYDWLGASAVVNNSYGKWAPPQFDADAEITFLINRELRKRGMSQSSVNPDLVVAYAAGINMDALKLKVDPLTKMKLAQKAPQGALVVLLVDNESGFVIWEGSATAEIQEKSDTQRAKARLDFAVSEMFKKLPK